MTVDGVPTLYAAAPLFGFALFFAVIALSIPSVVALTPAKWRESGDFRAFVLGMWIVSAVSAAWFLIEGLTKLATG